MEDPNDPSGTVSLGETIAIDGPTAEDVIDRVSVGPRLMALVESYTADPDEYLLMELRWGMGDQVSYFDVAHHFTSSTGRPMNHDKVAAVERSVFERIRHHCESDPEAMEEFHDLLRVVANTA
jgi:hypothetical protein